MAKFVFFACVSSQQPNSGLGGSFPRKDFVTVQLNIGAKR